MPVWTVGILGHGLGSVSSAPTRFLYRRQATTLRSPTMGSHRGTMAWVELAHSKSQVKRAGKMLRDSVRHPLTIDEQTVREAELVLEN